MPSRYVLSIGAGVAAGALIIGCGAMGSPGGNPMSFFITSVNPGKGGDLGGWPEPTASASRWPRAPGRATNLGVLT
jgi:hypothetical protein